MPRDDFARLERRWREQPLFLPRRRHLPLWPLVIALLCVAVTLGSMLFDQEQLAGMIAGAEKAFNAHATPATTQSEPVAGAPPPGGR